jgi:hypothetical protein
MRSASRLGPQASDAHSRERGHARGGNYYANHQKKGAFKHLKVADIFMGGGTTLVEGSRLGMQMSGNDLNPVAWFVVKQELADVDLDEVEWLLAAIEAEVRPQIIPFYYCDGPHGEKGTWTHVPTGRVEGSDFDPLLITPDQRRDYRYEGPEIIYTFWGKHGPCQVTGCGHRTPIMTSAVMATKTLTVKSWPHKCDRCDQSFDIEDAEARMRDCWQQLIGIDVSEAQTDDFTGEGEPSGLLNLFRGPLPIRLGRLVCCHGQKTVSEGAAGHSEEPEW